MSLTPNDFNNLLSLVRRSEPNGFDEGKELVVLEGKLIQILQAGQQTELDNRVTKEIAVRAAAIKETQTDGDIPPAD